jgi:hypothetical protein
MVRESCVVRISIDRSHLTTLLRFALVRIDNGNARLLLFNFLRHSSKTNNNSTMNRRKEKDQSQSSQHALANRESIVATSIGGISAGLVASVITCPLDVVKTRMQAQAGATAHHVRYRGTVSSLRKILAEEGLRGLCNSDLLPVQSKTSLTTHSLLFLCKIVACGPRWLVSLAIGLCISRAMIAFRRRLEA